MAETDVGEPALILFPGVSHYPENYAFICSMSHLA